MSEELQVLGGKPKLSRKSPRIGVWRREVTLAVPLPQYLSFLFWEQKSPAWEFFNPLQLSRSMALSKIYMEANREFKLN